MTNEPQTVDEIYETIATSLTGKISKLTNFTNRSFNAVLTQAISTRFREIEVEILAAELSGYVEYAGGPITNEDLRRLGLEDSVDADELSEYMKDEHLDNLVELVGVARDNGQKASGFVDLDTDQDSFVTIPEGTVLTTLPDSQGNVLEYETLRKVEVQSGTETAIDIEVAAVETRSEYNIPADSIVRLQSPPIGVTGIPDSTAITGGEDVETNDELRERAKVAIQNEPTGGTVRGLRGFIVDEVESVTAEDIGITELFDNDPVLVEVTVDGGNSTEIETAIENGRPIGVKHELLRPKAIEVSINGQVLGGDIDTAFTTSEVESYLLDDLRVGDNLYTTDIIREIMNADSNIINVSELEIVISQVSNERKIFDATKNTQKYDLMFTYDDGDVSITDSSDTLYEENTDYRIIDDSGDGIADTIEWLSASEPNNGENFFIDYSVNRQSNEELDEEHIFRDTLSNIITFDSQIDEYKLNQIPFTDSVSIEDTDSTSYTQGTDYEIVNSPIDRQTDEFTYTSGRAEYELNRSTFSSSTTVSIDDQTFKQGVDYQVIDADNDSIEETISWIDNGSSPSNGQDFTVTYDVDNGLEQTVRWIDSGSSPSNGQEFTVSYSQQVYELNNNIDTIIPEQVSCNCPGTEYVYETDFDFVDVLAEDVKDSIRWISGGNQPGDGVSFYVTYQSNGHIEITEQQKIDPATVTITDQ